MLVLDVDGVIVKSQPNGQGEWYDHLFDDLGIDPDQLHLQFFEPSWNDIVCGRRNLRTTLEPVLGQMGVDASVDDLLTYWFRRHSLVDCAVIEFVVEWSRRTGRRPWIASNQEQLRASYLWQDLNLRTYFDGFIYSSDIGVTKSDAEFFRIANERMFGDREANVIYYDDDKGNVESARLACWDARLYRGVKDLESTLPDGRPLMPRYCRDC